MTYPKENMDTVKRIAFSVTQLKSNRYVSLLVDALRHRNLSVEKISVGGILWGGVQIIHVHWPEHFLRKLTSFANVRLLLGFLLILRIAKLKKVPLLWTVHNVVPHVSVGSDKVTKWFFNKWANSVDACIYMTASSRLEAEKMYPVLKGKPFKVIPHGSYVDIIPAGITKSSARENLNLSGNDFVISHCGVIRPNKNLDALAECFSQCQVEGLKLVIAGNCANQVLAGRLSQLACADSRIRFVNRFISDDEMAQIAIASDLVVLPYSEFTNSGVALYALSVERPILAPNRGSFRDLREKFGEWVQVYSGRFDSEVLLSAVERIRREWVLGSIDLSDFSWGAVADATIGFYEELLVKDKKKK